MKTVESDFQTYCDLVDALCLKICGWSSEFEKQILNESSDLLYLHSHKLKLEKEIELKKKELEDLS